MEIAKMFARKGADVASFDLKPLDELAGYITQQGRKHIAITGNITSIDDIRGAVQKICGEWGKIDILVNSAGIGGTAAVSDHTEEMWDKIIDVNLKGTVFMAQEVGKTMIANGGGKIINLGSQAGVVALDGHLAYGASKAGVIYITKQLALEWARYNVNINCISPTVIMTEMVKTSWSPEKVEEFKKTIPAQRLGYPEEVAACALFLASDASSLFNGANLVIDGGFTIA
jgi:NAD(P)-dependent dehydrogenase (short-subunit alcohol dehydrogenase family)